MFTTWFIQKKILSEFDKTRFYRMCERKDLKIK